MHSIQQSYSVEGVLGQGSFGTIWRVKCRQNGKLYACKMEKQSNIKEVLVKKEYEVLKDLEITQKFPIAHELGCSEGTHYLIMDLLGRSLEQLRMQTASSRLQIKTVALIARQLLQSLESMHRHGYLHRDLKPDNILLTRDSHRLCLIDFGLSKKVQPPPRRTVSIIGNVRFASRGAHVGLSSRMDDLQSMCYVLLYLYQGWLPWQKLPVDQIKRQLQRRNTLDGPTEFTPMLELKQTVCPDMFEPATSSKEQLLFLRQLIALTRQIQQIEFAQVPDYEHLGYLVGRLLFISDAFEDNCYEWCQRDCPHQQGCKKYWKVYEHAD